MLKFWRALNTLYAYAMIAFFAFIMVIGIWQVLDNYYLYTHTLDNSVLRYKPQPSDSAVQNDSPITDSMVGWITLNGTNIDYPVMQAADNTYFLATDPFGQYSQTGSIFLDCRSSPDFSDAFSIVYGHHMDYGKMFGALDAYLSESYLAAHADGTLLVGRNAEESHGLRVFAAMRVSAREKTVFDMQQETVAPFIEEHAAVFTEQRSDRILGLSTCADANTTERIVVFCYITD